ncbi:MAG: primosomal protein N', partial [Sulfurimonadaceae bacterium]|nr:primosomal protein N' [Sulfurimonadaceae bacterium]
PHTEAITEGIERYVDAMAQKEEQGIVFIPTRANFKYIICGDCGFTYECPYCSVGMSLHRNARAVKCHYCNFSEPIPQRCPKCHSGSLVSSRLGTAEAVEYFQEHLPDAVIEQFDRDVITTQNKLKAALKRFNDGETDLLVGTQMLSKGHDYHDVTLAVVLGMDNILHLSDYRAREKALSMLVQIAGRSGRKKEATVVVQSFNQEFFAAYLGNYEQFLDEEKVFREGMYPPFKKLCRILFAHKNGIKAREAMEETVMQLQRFGTIDIVGSGPSAIEKIAGKYRFQILLRADKSTDLIRALKVVKQPLAEVDMDPVEFH